MNWRRGLIFAVVHLALAGALIGWDAVERARYCGGYGDCGAGILWRTVAHVNVPAACLSGALEECPLPTLIPRRIESTAWRAMLSIFGVLVFAQWLLVGAVNLVKNTKWRWLEPRMLLTFCVLLGVATAFQNLWSFNWIPLITSLLWLVWIGWSIARLTAYAFRSMRQKLHA